MEFYGQCIARVCCEAVRSAILATAWLLVTFTLSVLVRLSHSINDTRSVSIFESWQHKESTSLQTAVMSNSGSLYTAQCKQYLQCKAFTFSLVCCGSSNKKANYGFLTNTDAH